MKRVGKLLPLLICLIVASALTATAVATEPNSATSATGPFKVASADNLYYYETVLEPGPVVAATYNINCLDEVGTAPAPVPAAKRCCCCCHDSALKKCTHEAKCVLAKSSGTIIEVGGRAGNAVTTAGQYALCESRRLFCGMERAGRRLRCCK